MAKYMRLHLIFKSILLSKESCTFSHLGLSKVKGMQHFTKFILTASAQATHAMVMNELNELSCWKQKGWSINPRVAIDSQLSMSFIGRIESFDGFVNSKDCLELFLFIRFCIPVDKIY